MLTVSVYQSKDENRPGFVKNVGNEAYKYLRYIVDNYDDLPEYVMFVQASAQDWHDPQPKLDIIQSWDWTSPSKAAESVMPGEGRGIQFLPTPQCIIEAVDGPPIEQNANRDGCVYHQPRQLSALKDAWSTVFERELGPLPPEWRTHCCAQFEVTREAIRQHPAQFYQSVLDWVDENDSTRLERMGRHISEASRRQALHDAKDRGDSGHVLEVAWALIFGRNARNMS